ncbi:MAG: PaaI family thioesterase [Gammaproteobacteria bacterium]|jgi:acyl-coenzyme A thioesterase PaaI-like protein|nr:PaaI family thioesterase [Gammaproteobacteria bacterium]
MPEADAKQHSETLHELINADAVQLIRHLRCSAAPEDALSAATTHIQQAIEVLKPWLQEGQGWSTITIAQESSGLPWAEEDITAVMPYSPVSGKRNPVAPPIKLWRDGNDVRGAVVFSPTYAGPPDAVHGGIIAAVFDELLAMANVVSGHAGFTGTLTIKYHKLTPLNETVELWASNLRQDGRKQISRGEMRVNGEITAVAEGLFIAAAAKD